jgi:hypothetical protein
MLGSGWKEIAHRKPHQIPLVAKSHYGELITRNPFNKPIELQRAPLALPQLARERYIAERRRKPQLASMAVSMVELYLDRQVTGTSSAA